MNKEDRETYITYNDGKHTATVLTYSVKLKNRLAKLAKEYPDKVGMNARTGTLEEYWVPKEWVRIQPPRRLSEAQMEAARENARRMAEAKKRARIDTGVKTGKTAVMDMLEVRDAE